jgi:hypothetical protein
MKKRFSSRTIAAFVIISMLVMTFAVFSVHAVSTRIYLAPSNKIYTTDTASVGTKFNVTVWAENAPNIGGAQIYLEFNDTIINVTRWFEPKDDPQYVFFGKGTSALPTPPNDAAYQHLGPNKGKVLISVSLFPPSPPYFTGSGKICVFEFKITKVPTVGNYTSGLVMNSDNTFMLDGDTGNNVPGVNIEDGYYEIRKVVAPPKKFTLTITANTGGSTNPAIGKHDYVEGTVVSVQAFNNSGYIFDHWELDGNKIGSDNPVSVTMDGNHTLHAAFKAFGNQGDITGPDGVPDGKVDLMDVMKVARAFVSYGPGFLGPNSPPHPKWDEKCDLNGDNKVDLLDLFIVWKNYGKVYS